MELRQEEFLLASFMHIFESNSHSAFGKIKNRVLTVCYPAAVVKTAMFKGYSD